MRLLLDTHSFLWFAQGDPKLSKSAQELISNATNRVYVSVVSAWEISIKYGLGKLRLPDPPEIFFPKVVELAKFEVIPVGLNHVLAVHKLPAHHRDPFDRLLIAQCQAEDLAIVSVDAAFSLYDLKRVG